MGSARNLRKLGAHARPFALAFHFQLEHARVEGKPRRRLPSPCRRKKALSTRSQLICWPLLQHFWVGWGPNRMNGGLRRGKCQRDKQALQTLIFLVGFSWTTLMLLCTRVPKLHVPAAELWKELVLDVHEASCHLDKHGRRCM